MKSRTREQVFEAQLQQVDVAQQKALTMQKEFELKIVALRKTCPHLHILQAEIPFERAGKVKRVCKHCSIEETAYPSNFFTLTLPGGTWYRSHAHDYSLARRGEREPVLTPMSWNDICKARRGPRDDRSDGKEESQAA